MRSSPGRSHTPVRLSAPLERHLNYYALAASAAGVSLLALAQPAEAKIIYTKTHQAIGMNGIYPLDLNHDGIIDFLIAQSAGTAESLLAQAAYGNAVEGNNFLASALKKGSFVGPGRSFTGSVAWGAKMAYYACTEGGGCRWSGQWGNVTDRYLGLRFQIDKNIHYGWARLSTKTQGSQITTTLTGYAYETVANKGIRAGQTSGGTDGETSSAGATRQIPNRSADVRPVSQTTKPVSLGHLALGAGGLAPWRRQ